MRLSRQDSRDSQKGSSFDGDQERAGAWCCSYSMILLTLAVLGLLIAVLMGLALQPPRVEILVSLGSVSAEWATIYVQAPASAEGLCLEKVHVMHRPAGDIKASWGTSGLLSLKGGSKFGMITCSVVVKLAKLKPATTYEFVATITNSETPLSGVFTTFPPPGAPSRFTMSISSCLGFFPLLPVWPLRHLLPTDAAFLIGDAIYADFPWSLGQTFEHLYLRLVQDPSFKALTSAAPLFTMYDDHEVMDNWDQGDAHPWPEAIGNWTAFLGGRNPPKVARGGGGGEQFTFQHGDVCGFVLDVRRRRDSGKGKILGGDQVQQVVAWAESARTCRVLVLVSPNTFATMNGSTAVNEGWGTAPDERSRVLGALAGSGKPSIVLTGDSHWAAAYTLDHGIVEISASPLFQVPLSPFITGSTLVQEADFVSTLSMHFARVGFDTASPTPTVNVAIEASYLGIAAFKTVWSRNFTLADLVPRANGQASRGSRGVIGA